MAKGIVFGTPNEPPVEGTKSQEVRAESASVDPEIHTIIAASIRSAQTLDDFSRAVSAARSINPNTVDYLKGANVTEPQGIVIEISLPAFTQLENEADVYNGLKSNTKAPNQGRVVIAIQKVDEEDDQYRVLFKSNVVNPGFDSPDMTKVGLQQDLEDTRQIKGEELIYMAPKSGCVKRACKKLLGDDLQTEVEVDFSTREDVFDRLNKGGALSGGTLTYVESVHDATDYLLFPAHGAFDNEIPLPMSLYDGEV